VKRQIDEFFNRLRPILQAPDIARAALEAGLVQWTANPPPEGVTERGGFSDLDTGEGLTTTFFESAVVAPLAYPPELPWIPHAHTAIAEFAFGGNVMRSMSWSGAPRLREDAMRLVSEFEADGWTPATPVDAPAMLPDSEVVGWLRRDDRMRLLMLATTADDTILTVLDFPVKEG
jgi:hypothetical protein